jgi:hypothetical protein
MISGETIYEIVWAVFAICLGTFGLFFMHLFIEVNVKLCKYIFHKTNLGVFKYYADNMDTDSVRLTAYIVAVVLITGGVKLLWGFANVK